MKKFRVKMSAQADSDVQNLFNAIAYEYKSYNTAEKYVNGLRETIHSLQSTAESFQIQDRPYFRKYGLFVYRINYKKMAIIYTIQNNLVVIEEVIPASLITD